MLCCAAQGFNTIAIDTWLEVIPQIIARIHTQSPQIRRLIHELLVRVGREHPQVRCDDACMLDGCRSQSAR
jgi:FKBP12-rapamycin complex-associated protein